MAFLGKWLILFVASLFPPLILVKECSGGFISSDIGTSSLF
jgi:hypothetical protein